MVMVMVMVMVAVMVIVTVSAHRQVGWLRQCPSFHRLRLSYRLEASITGGPKLPTHKR